VPLTEFSVHFALLQLVYVQLLEVIMSSLINKHPNSMKVYLRSIYALILLIIPTLVNVEFNVEVDIYWEMVHQDQSTYDLSLC